MAHRKIIAYTVDAALLHDIAELLNQLPARTSRPLLNRIDNRAHCTPILEAELGNKQPLQDPQGDPEPE